MQCQFWKGLRDRVVPVRGDRRGRVPCDTIFWDMQPELPVHVYLLALEGDHLGDAFYTSDDEGNIEAYHIRLSLDLSPSWMQATTVHELFHVFQFAMGLTW